MQEPTQGRKQGSSRIAHYVDKQLITKMSYRRHLTNTISDSTYKLCQFFSQAILCILGISQRVVIVIIYHRLDKFLRSAHIHNRAKKVCLQCHFLCEFARHTYAVQGILA